MMRTKRLRLAALAAALIACAAMASCAGGDPNKKLIEKTLDYYWQDRPGAAIQPRSMLLDIYGNGRYSKLRTGRGEDDFVETAGYFTSQSGSRGWAAVIKDLAPMPEFVGKAGKDVVEDAPNMAIAILADAGLDREAWIVTSTGDSPAFKKFIEASMYLLDPAEVAATSTYVPGREGNALGWTLSAFADYGLTEQPWVNQHIVDNKLHETVSMTDLLRVALKRPLTWGDNAGLDENQGIAVAVRRHREAIAKDKQEAAKGGKHIDPWALKLSGTWRAADERARKVLSLAKKNQNKDGTFSAAWAKSPTPEKDKALRVRFTARVLDIAAATLTKKELREKWVDSTVKALCALMLENRAAVRMDPIATAYGLHALRSYRDRMSPVDLTPIPEQTCNGKNCMDEGKEKKR